MEHGEPLLADDFPRRVVLYVVGLRPSQEKSDNVDNIESVVKLEDISNIAILPLEHVIAVVAQASIRRHRERVLLLRVNLLSS